MQNRQIKFIWDFFGDDSYEIADHHAKHLRTFFSLHQIDHLFIDAIKESEFKSIAYVIASELQVDIIKNSLKPHRATIENV